MPIKGEPRAVLEKLACLGQAALGGLEGKAAQGCRSGHAAFHRRPAHTEVRLADAVPALTSRTGARRADRRRRRRPADPRGLAAAPRRPGRVDQHRRPLARDPGGTLTEPDRGVLSWPRDSSASTNSWSRSSRRAEDVAEPCGALDPGAAVDGEDREPARSRLDARRRRRAARDSWRRAAISTSRSREPHQILAAVERLLRLDPDAIVASRDPALARARASSPTAQDSRDVAFLLSLGYRTFLLGDEVCQRRDSVDLGAQPPRGLFARSSREDRARPDQHERGQVAGERGADQARDR